MHCTDMTEHNIGVCARGGVTRSYVEVYRLYTQKLQNFERHLNLTYFSKF
jgi:hypothetical protein